MDGGSVGRSYTKGRRQPYLIRKWPGSNWALPLGPYTITQLVTFVASVYVLLAYRDVWAHFGPFNLIIGVGIPLLLTYVTRHTRIEGRDPLRAGVALASLLLQPSTGYLRGGPVKTQKPVRQRGGRFPIAALPQPAGLPYPVSLPAVAHTSTPREAQRYTPRHAEAVTATEQAPAKARTGRWLAELIEEAKERR
jgi:hypothetical protein